MNGLKKGIVCLEKHNHEWKKEAEGCIFLLGEILQDGMMINLQTMAYITGNRNTIISSCMCAVRKMK